MHQNCLVWVLAHKNLGPRMWIQGHLISSTLLKIIHRLTDLFSIPDKSKVRKNPYSQHTHDTYIHTSQIDTLRHRQNSNDNTQKHVHNMYMYITCTGLYHRIKRHLITAKLSTQCCCGISQPLPYFESSVLTHGFWICPYQTIQQTLIQLFLSILIFLRSDYK